MRDYLLPWQEEKWGPKLPPYPRGMVSQEISKLVNSPKNETPDVLKPVSSVKGEHNVDLTKFM